MSSNALHVLRATPRNCFWGFFDRALPPVLTVRSGDIVHVETLTHQAGDAPDLLMDDGVHNLSYCDPFVPKLSVKGQSLSAQPMNEATLENSDLVIIATDHTQYDYEFIARHAPHISSEPVVGADPRVRPRGRHMGRPLRRNCATHS